MKLSKIQKIRKELERLPKYKCKSWCYECCTTLKILPEEEVLLKKELRKNWYTSPPKWKGDGYCKYLTKEGKCSVYHARPIICRSFWNTSFVLTAPNWESIKTQVCSYANKIYEIIPSKEWIDYWKELITKGEFI